MNAPLDRITIDPKVCGEKPCMKGKRSRVSLVVDFLADGMTETELLAEYPNLPTRTCSPPSSMARKQRAKSIVPVLAGHAA